MILAASTTFISAISAVAALVGVLAYVYGLRRGDQTAARDEALALAETRRQAADELRRRLTALERGQKQARAQYKSRVRHLEASLEDTRRDASAHAYEMQRVFLLALEELLLELRRELQKVPPDVRGALARIDDVLADKEVKSSAR